MKCLNWMTPNEALKQEVNTYKFNRYQNTLKCSGEIQG